MASLACALRSVAEARGLALVAAGTLALGIGANAAVFSVVDAVLLRPLPYPESDRIVLLSSDSAHPFVRFRADVGFEVFPPQLRESRVFAAVGAAGVGGVNLGGERPIRVRAARVTSDFFRVLGVEPFLGRVFDEDDLDEDQRLAVIGHGLWERELGADADVVGREIRLNDMAVLVMGVMPPRVNFPERAEVWVSARGDWQLESPARKIIVTARLSDQASLPHALGELNRIDEELGAGFSNRRLRPLREVLVGEMRPVLSLIAWGAAFVLLVACINVANLLFTRMASREQEWIVRRVLGASRLKLAGQLLLEGVVLSTAGGIAALPVAGWTLQGIRTLVPPALHGASDLAMNGRAMAGLAAFALLTALLVGLLPAVLLPERVSSYARGAFGATFGPLQRRLRSGLVVAEVAMALVLLASAVTLLGTVDALMKTDIGARGDAALVVDITLPRASYPSRGSIWQLYERLIHEVRGVAGVAAVGVSDQLPGAPTKLLPARPIRLNDGPETSNRFAVFSCASDDYFDSLGIDLVAGRAFTPRDGPGSAVTAVVSESFARALDLQPSEIIGRHTNAARMMEPAESRRIVGVVRDVRFRGPEDELAASLYVPCAEEPPLVTGHLVVEARVDPATLVPAIRRAAARLDGRLPLYNIRAFEDIRADYLAGRRLAMTTTSAFGLLAFVMAVVGLYGVVSYLVQLRTREIGIRLAFGATPAEVKRRVLANGLLHAAAGAAIGVLAALGLGELAWASIAGLGHVDPARLLAVVVTVGAVAAAASWLPARRATRIDPSRALRYE